MLASYHGTSHIIHRIEDRLKLTPTKKYQGLDPGFSRPVAQPPFGGGGVETTYIIWQFFQKNAKIV